MTGWDRLAMNGTYHSSHIPHTKPAHHCDPVARATRGFPNNVADIATARC
jgi:hypothetical protein